MGEFESLNQALPLKIGERPLAVQFDRFRQSRQRLAVVRKALLPADVGRGCHG